MDKRLKKELQREPEEIRTRYRQLVDALEQRIQFERDIIELADEANDRAKIQAAKREIKNLQAQIRRLTTKTNEVLSIMNA